MPSRDALLFDEAPDAGGVERPVGPQRDRPALEDAVEHRPLRVPVHERRERERRARIAGHRLLDLLRGGDRRPAVVPAPHGGEEDVLLAPHDALRHPGGAAGVEDIDVVGGARAEVAFGRRRGQRVLVAHDVAVREGRAVGGGLAAVVDHDDAAQLRHVGQYFGDHR
jgi:hypothetical protein